MKQALQTAQSQEKPNLNISQQLGVSRKALSDRYSGSISLNASPDKKPYLTEEEEATLVKFLIEVSSLGFGYNLRNLKTLIRQLLGKSNETVTDGWVSCFFKRHPEITL